LAKQSLSIIIPAYNEENGINATITKLKAMNKDYEIIVVDDGSTDNTYKIAKANRVKIIRHPYNKGYGAALKTGIREASANLVLFIDADNQHSPDDIPELVKYADTYDMVVGARTGSSDMSLFRRFGRKIFNALANYLAEMKIPDLNSGFRVVKKDVVMEFMNILPNEFSFTTTLTLAMIKEGYNLKYVPVKTFWRTGKSKVRPFRDGFRFILLILGTVNLFSPLKIFLPIALILSIIGVIEILHGIIYYRNISDSALLLILSAILIFFFGLLADQIAHIRRQVK